MNLEGIPMVGWTAPGVLLLVVILILTGRLVPRSILRDKAEEAKEWRIAYEKERDARTLSDAQTRDLLEGSKTSDAIVRALFKNSEEIRNRGDSNASTSS